MVCVISGGVRVPFDINIIKTVAELKAHIRTLRGYRHVDISDISSSDHANIFVELTDDFELVNLQSEKVVIFLIFKPVRF